MEYIDFSGQAGLQDLADETSEVASQQVHHVDASLYLQDPTRATYLNPNFPHSMSCDIKPRLTKEQHDVLEAHYQKQNKPNTNIKKGFAEALGVSLDKVNNWFQNRRAKSKQDAKKQSSAMNLYAVPSSSLPDCEMSPGFLAAPEYDSMMQQWTADRQGSRGLGISQPYHANGLPVQYFQDPASSIEQYQSYLMPHQMPQDMFDTEMELNRRTLTQEQFDAMEANGGMVNGSAAYHNMPSGFSGGQQRLSEVFSDLANDFKQQDVFTSYPQLIDAPLSSNDSTVPSIVSDQSLPMFPSSSNMQDRTNLSATSSERTDSRSSSIYDGAFPHMPPVTDAPQQSAAISHQWQPGQSVPVDFSATMEEFRQAAQTRSMTQHPLAQEQPLAWPEDDAYARRGSQTSLLTHSMSAVELQTPAPPQSATFKSPAPPASIAARRQRPKPAALGLTSLRSQSYSSAVQPGSPNIIQQPQTAIENNQHLRRIRSSNVLGGVAQGRVMKNGTGSAQRSPLHRSFAEAINSSHAMRHMSAQSLAPPTPLSPGEFPRTDLPRHYSPSQGISTNASRQHSISETDVEHGFLYQPPASVPTRNFSSPPHTPMYYQQQFVPQSRFGTYAHLENTPPQSAPASQSCFPSNIWGVSQPQMQQAQTVFHNPQQQAPAMSQGQRYSVQSVPDQQFQVPNFARGPFQQTNVSASHPSSELPTHFASGVPIINAEGNIQMAYPPPHMQFMQQEASQAQRQQMHTPPQASYPFAPSAGGSPNVQETAPAPNVQPASDFFVHEYSPPDAIKRAATPRKTVDTGPKNYTFANAGPEHFEDKKAKKGENKETGASSSSPASSLGTASTS